jgi:ppGpp synthetase/RelA/SpoT-type nucleotidyltranferase
MAAEWEAAYSGVLSVATLKRKVSKTQIDRLGDRLRRGPIVEIDIRMLDDYRRSFAEAYDHVVRAIRERLPLDPTGRPAKSTDSIIDKLRRESIRLSQVQDIAGCRILVSDVLEQNRVVDSLRAIFTGALVVDRRAVPSYGYRAVHVIVPASGQLIEIQVRSRLQHLWAELSEKYSDVFGPAIKYGGGREVVRRMLMSASEMVAESESENDANL